MRAFSFSLVVGATTLATSAAPEALPDLSAHLWKNRILIVDTPTTTAPAYATQAAALLPDWSGLLERDLHVITRDAAPAFRVRLVGKDGGVKLDQTTPVSAADLFALIDAMPMRRAEQRSDSPRVCLGLNSVRR
ncbi:MAG: DUF4174 domain-containing protein [Opitutaceae bacterium]|jgi:hypothetical protein|nr:DUF4174 domain-containing protein [Opitutaceae bacterium]